MNAEPNKVLQLVDIFILRNLHINQLRNCSTWTALTGIDSQLSRREGRHEIAEFCVNLNFLRHHRAIVNHARYSSWDRIIISFVWLSDFKTSWYRHLPTLGIPNSFKRVFSLISLHVLYSSETSSIIREFSNVCKWTMNIHKNSLTYIAVKLTKWTVAELHLWAGKAVLIFVLLVYDVGMWFPNSLTRTWPIEATIESDTRQLGKEDIGELRGVENWRH